MLSKLILKLSELYVGSILKYSIVIVDNDKLESAHEIVESYAQTLKIPIKYYVELEQNISLSRNKAIVNSDGDYVALIDDDEFPDQNWLFNLYKNIIQFKADGILAPVLPYFEVNPPAWVLKGHFFDRKTHETGHILKYENTRTGNALLKRQIFSNNQIWFDPKFGSGGEDRDFFKRQIEAGRKFVWCNDAPVYETVPPVRWRKSVLLKRALLRGKMAANTVKSKPISLLISLIAIAIYISGMPLFLILGQHVFIKYLIKAYDHLGKIFTFIGIDLIKEKYIHC
jgi:succinoglycan biosynthesis protein ExoM